LENRQTMKVKLTSHDVWSPPLEFAIREFPAILGRNGKADFAVEGRWTSDQHCELHEIDGQLRVRDLESDHGTWVNHERVDQAILNSGDTLSIGIRTFRVSYRRPKKSDSDVRSGSSQTHASAADKAATAS